MLRNIAQSLWLSISVKLETITNASAKLETSTKTNAKLETSTNTCT